MKLKTWLVKKKISQRQFAIKLGISPSAICRYLNGSRIPSFSIIKKIKKITNNNVIVNDWIK